MLTKRDQVGKCLKQIHHCLISKWYLNTVGNYFVDARKKCPVPFVQPNSHTVIWDRRYDSYYNHQKLERRKLLGYRSFQIEDPQHLLYGLVRSCALWVINKYYHCANKLSVDKLQSEQRR